WKLADVPEGTHKVLASSGGTLVQEGFEVPCDDPIDLTISDPLIPSPPSLENESFEVQVVITNTGQVDALQQFFVDVFIDPVEVDPDNIPLYQSDGYQAVNGLAAGSSKKLIINVPAGFTSGSGEDHEVWAMVDSFLQIAEADEENNIGGPIMVSGVITGTTGTPTPAPGGDGEISGFVRLGGAGAGKITPQPRTQLWLLDEGNRIVSTTFSDLVGHYEFLDIETARYSVYACAPVDGSILTDNLTGLVPTTTVADLVLLVDVGCPYW
ncbi:MAG: CARDB domain-containing protein, partial [Candidatus Promineifilaceae bacterium]